ncbi:hypothetical protein B4N89_18395 [Embleya scabrispora]|uniref:WxL domain-containing protein n=1 Tax=Embleya scabrispora TaxID=159449 RepID=A0A1T3P0M0_9ACTN|nr:hypothetical protein [Embleya scabrispora]OPC82648.1 hypothetical protein B4N89_18395 [Embleya scabrispora]
MHRTRHITRRVLTSLATAITVATTGLVVVAAPAGAAAVAFPERCVLNGPTSPVWGVDEPRIDLTVQPQKALYSAGELITVTWHWQTRPSVPVPPGSGGLRMGVRAEVSVGGSRSTTFTVSGWPRRQPESPGASIDVDDLTGTFRLPESGPITLTPGPYEMFENLSPFPAMTCSPTVPAAVSRTVDIGPGPTLNVTPTRIVTGRRVEFTGEGWPDGDARVEVCATPTEACLPEWVGSVTGGARNGHLAGSVTVDADTSGSIPVLDKVYLRVMVGTFSATRELTRVTASPGSVTRVTGTVLPGGLTLRQEAGTAKLSDITLNGTAQAMTGALNPVTVTDVRGGSLGWTLTADVSDFASPEGGRIPADRFTWTPSVRTDPASPGTATPGSPGRVAGGSTLASAPAGAHGGGTFTAGAAIAVAVPAYQKPGTYSATLTLSIS